MPERDGQCIAGEVAVVRGMLVEAADAAAGEDHVVRVHHVERTVLERQNGAVADIVLLDDVDHGRVLHEGDVRQGLDRGQQFAGDLPAGDVIVEQDALVGVGTFLRKEELPLRVLFELGAVGHEVPDDVL